MTISISEHQIQSWIEQGVKSAIDSYLRNSYGDGPKLKAAMDKAIAESQPEILAALKIGISHACVAPSFLANIEREIASSLASQYRGAFDGVIRAAAKQAASNEVVARRVVELTQQAAGIKGDQP